MKAFVAGVSSAKLCLRASIFGTFWGCKDLAEKPQGTFRLVDHKAQREKVAKNPSGPRDSESEW